MDLLTLLNSLYSFLDLNSKKQSILFLNLSDTTLASQLVNQDITFTNTHIDYESLSEKEHVSTFEMGENDFIKLARDTQTQYNLIFYFIGEQEVRDFQDNQIDRLKKVQRTLLKDSGVLILLVDNNNSNFVLSNYLRPGSDGLTKKILGEKRDYLVYAFYN